MKKLLLLLIPLIIVIGLLLPEGKQPEGETTLPEPSQETTQTAEIKKSFTLGYFKGKSFNPFTTESPANRRILSLVYDGLYTLDSDYTPVPVIASDETNEGNELTVSIGEELYFSDGSRLSAADVCDSFYLAKNSAHYGSSLSNFLSARPTGDGVVFTLERADVFATAALTFPIVKSGTGAEKYPVGSGRYVIRSADGELYLSANDTNSRDEELNLEKISLVPISSEEDELYLLQSGDLTFYYDDLSDGEYTKITANIYKTSTNNLLFLTFNSQSEYFTEPSMKKAILSCLDLSSACMNAYSGMTLSPKGPFNPEWYLAASVDENADSYDFQKGCQLLEENGYVYAYSNNKYRSKNFEYIVLDLLYCSDNPVKAELASALRENLELAGISVNAVGLSYSDYIKALQRGEFDLYLGEVKLSANMSLDCFFSEQGSARYGIDLSQVTAKAYYDFSGGSIDINTFVSVFEKELPFVPLCYRQAVSYYSRELSFDGNVSEAEPFRDIYTWE